VFRLDEHESRLSELAAQLESRLLQRREIARLLVRGAAGSGRRAILQQLARRPEIVTIDPPGLTELDCALGGLVQAASHLPEYQELVTDRRSETGDVDQDMARRAEAVGQALAGSGKAVALLVPPSWSDPDQGADAMACLGRARAFVAGLEAVPKLPILLLGAPPPGSRAHAYSTIELPPLRLEASDLDPGALRGELRAAGERLAQHLRATRAEVSPALLRLRLGLIALGLPPASLDDLHTVALARQLARRLPHRAATGLRRLLLARRALEPAVAGQLTGLGGEELELVTTCVAYGREQFQIAEPARAVLLEQLREAGHRLPPAELEAGHQLLADHYHSIDGASRIDGLPPAQATAFLETLHHLAHGGAGTAEAWRARRPFSRELLWARGRWLGETRQHKQAASLFRDSLGFGDHPYAHHRYAFHMDRDKGDREMIEHHYRDAVTFEPENPWWNARLVTFLIEQGSYDKARQEWREVPARVDPAGSRMRESSQLALHVHHPIASAWLARGQVPEARTVLDDVPPRHLRLAQPLARLAQALADAEESTRLGASVHPPEVPAEERWSAPRVLAGRTAAGAPLEEWWPGRVLTASEAGVTLVIATRDAAQQISFTGDEWRQSAGESPAAARGYLELGRYQDGSRVVRRVPAAPPTDEYYPAQPE
jgi:hypothetical protein